MNRSYRSLTTYDPSRMQSYLFFQEDITTLTEIGEDLSPP